MANQSITAIFRSTIQDPCTNCAGGVHLPVSDLYTTHRLLFRTAIIIIFFFQIFCSVHKVQWVPKNSRQFFSISEEIDIVFFKDVSFVLSNSNI